MTGFKSLTAATSATYLSLSLWICFAPAQAAVESGTFFGLRTGLSYLDSERHLVIDDEPYNYRTGLEHPSLGLQLGYQFKQGIALRSYFDRLRASVSDYDGGRYGHSAGLDILLGYTRGFYVGIGINQTQLNEQRDALGRATLGLRLPLRDRFHAAVEYAAQGDGDWLDHHAQFNLNYTFGRDADTQMLPRELKQRRQSRHAAPINSTPPTPASSAESATPAQANHHSTTTEHAAQPQTGHLPPTTEHPAQVIHFDFNSATVDSQFYPLLSQLAAVLRQDEELAVTLIGHTDLVGDADHNLRLSHSRAQAIARVLQDEYGVSDSRIEIAAKGMQAPQVVATDAKSNGLNRRVEVKLSKRQGG